MRGCPGRVVRDRSPRAVRAQWTATDIGDRTGLESRTSASILGPAAEVVIRDASIPVVVPCEGAAWPDREVLEATMGPIPSLLVGRDGGGYTDQLPDRWRPIAAAPVRRGDPLERDHRPELSDTRSRGDRRGRTPSGRAASRWARRRRCRCLYPRRLPARSAQQGRRQCGRA